MPDTTGPAAIPPAITAAAEALERLHDVAPHWARQLATTAVNAAAPHLASCGDCHHNPRDPRVRNICECPCHLYPREQP